MAELNSEVRICGEAGFATLNRRRYRVRARDGPVRVMGHPTNFS
jgi:hypothetical protein